MARSKTKIAETLIPELGLSARSRNALIAHGVRTVGELQKLTPKDLLKIKNLGETSQHEIRRKLVAYGGALLDDARRPRELEGAIAAEKLRKCFHILFRRRWVLDAMAAGLTLDVATETMRAELCAAMAEGVLEG